MLLAGARSGLLLSEQGAVVGFLLCAYGRLLLPLQQGLIVLLLLRKQGAVIRFLLGPYRRLLLLLQ